MGGRGACALSESHPKSDGLLSNADMLVKFLPAADKQLHRKITILKDHGFTG
jgi:hypothetical protein